MFEIIDVTSLSAIVAAISVVAAVIFAILQMRHATKTRTTGLIVQLNPGLRASTNDLLESSKILNLEFNSYKEYLEKFGDPMSEKALITLASYYDGLGFLLCKQLIDMEIIEYIGRHAIANIWEKLKPIILGMRKDIGWPDLFEWFEYLSEEMQKK